ncbi:hypothetical protein V8D89_008578 [Ganoderma adspersum]
MFDHPTYNLHVLRTWNLRLGHYVQRDDRVGEGRVGLLMDGKFIPIPKLEVSSSRLPDTTEHTFNALVDPPRNPVKGIKPAILNDSCLSGVAPPCETPQASGAGVDTEGNVETAACPFPPYKDVEATHGPDATLLDDTYALLSYLTYHKYVATILKSLGFETERGRDIPRDSIVVVTQINTFDNATLEEILCWPLRDRTGIARALFEETSGRGGCHFSGVPDDEGRACALVLHHGDVRSEITLPVCGEAKPVFSLPGSGTDLVGVGDAEQAPAQVCRRASSVAENAVRSSTLGASTPTCTNTNMFIHYVRAMERPSIWQRVVDALYWAYCLGMALLGRVGREACYDPFKMRDDYFPLDELLRYMLAVVCADVAVASTMQLLEIFEDEDEVPVKSKDIRRALRRIRPTIIVEERYESSGGRRRVALLSRSASDTASVSTISEETLYAMDLRSKSEKWDDGQWEENPVKC